MRPIAPAALAVPAVPAAAQVQTGDLLHYCTAELGWRTSVDALQAGEVWNRASMIALSSEVWLVAPDPARVLVVELAMRMGEAIVIASVTSLLLEERGGEVYILETIKTQLGLIVPLMEEIPPTERAHLPSALMSAAEARRVAAICVVPLRPA